MRKLLFGVLIPAGVILGAAAPVSAFAAWNPHSQRAMASPEVRRADYEWHHHRYHHRRWDRDHHRYEYYD
jgi:hypothetical protein